MKEKLLKKNLKIALKIRKKTHHSVKLAATAAENPRKSKLISFAEQSPSPTMIGNRLKFVNKFVRSFVKSREIMTVKIGAEDLTVSVKDTAMKFRDRRPRRTVRNLFF